MKYSGILLVGFSACLAHAGNPLLPGGKWRVHDMNRPHPPQVTPGEHPGAPPSDAIVLFDGSGLDEWVGSKGQAPGWKLGDGFMQVTKTGNLQTVRPFGSCQLHVEWLTPDLGKTAQKNGNSGVFFMGLYEVQILNSLAASSYADGEAAAIYGQYPPLVNASRAPGEWQVYDAIFEAPVFDGDRLVEPAYLTLFHNGVLVHNHRAYQGPTAHKALARYKPHEPKRPLHLQDHGDPVLYRNIWIRPLD
jgi:hypothetical protein